ncbi:MAG: HU family DNA-binding protein [Puniceicoccales bacterium]|jgi:DNA-binding protein HU-beta|nr:HU family DNA-binding protein [Puniceicoccales bacterium]
MNKSELVDEAHSILDDGSLSKAAVERVLNAILAAIKGSVSKHETVQLVGFGTFSVVERAARTGINPQTKKKISIPKKSVVKFRPGTELSRSV